MGFRSLLIGKIVPGLGFEAGQASANFNFRLSFCALLLPARTDVLRNAYHSPNSSCCLLGIQKGVAHQIRKSRVLHVEAETKSRNNQPEHVATRVADTGAPKS